MELHINIKTQFDKNPALRVLFFFDESRNYEEHVKLWAYDDIVCIIADATPFHLKYQLENELKEKKYFYTTNELSLLTLSWNRFL